MHDSRYGLMSAKEENNHLPQPIGYASVDISQYIVSLHHCQGAISTLGVQVPLKTFVNLYPTELPALNCSIEGPSSPHSLYREATRLAQTSS